MTLVVLVLALVTLQRLIPSPDDQDRYAQWRRPTDMMVHG